VLGDLGELGDKEKDLHASLGEYAQQKQINHFFTLGVLSKYASEAFGKQEGTHHFTDRNQLIEQLQKIAAPDTTILIKGSRSAKMDLVLPFFNT
jgi:UDP-N-acetylmuramoyl-tripeptide--D-alanyl-D-alanine ligase